jgi:hypothetical protein
MIRIAGLGFSRIKLVLAGKPATDETVAARTSSGFPGPTSGWDFNFGNSWDT